MKLKHIILTVVIGLLPAASYFLGWYIGEMEVYKGPHATYYNGKCSIEMGAAAPDAQAWCDNVHQHVEALKELTSE